MFLFFLSTITCSLCSTLFPYTTLFRSTARLGNEFITNEALDEAIDRVVAGPQRRTRIMNDAERKITAYHEGGHALVAAAMRHTDPVSKGTILGGGRALGSSIVLPRRTQFCMT